MITDEMVELGCAAISQKRGYDWPSSWDEEELRIGRENMRAALSAALSVETRVKVKPLEWVDRHHTLYASSIFGEYAIWEIGGSVYMRSPGNPGGVIVGRTIEEGKEAALSHVADKIASALSVEQPTPQQHVKDLLDAAREVIACASDTYKKRNGHLASFEDDSGEKCWIVPFDAFEGLRSAVEALVTEGKAE